MMSFKKVMNDKKSFPSDAELMLLINRFDRNKNGQVSYQEFLEGLMPNQFKC